ncbi:hypothetical protein Bbelb_153630 [Branchiostoma belcheri]|nr:hypothetical protein Bbelb_153630 [Branchiostoma belcheri]
MATVLSTTRYVGKRPSYKRIKSSKSLLQEASKLLLRSLEETSKLLLRSLEEASRLLLRSLEEASKLLLGSLEEASKILLRSLEEANSVTTRRTCFCVLSTCKNVGKRRASVRVNSDLVNDLKQNVFHHEDCDLKASSPEH